MIIKGYKDGVTFMIITDDPKVLSVFAAMVERYEYCHGGLNV